MTQPYLTRLTRRVYWSPPDSARDRPILGAVTGRRSTLIVEAGASPAHASEFRAALQDLDAAPARLAAVTHWHWDHVFGIAELNLPTIAQRETRQRVAEMARLDWRDAALDARVAAGQELAFIAEHVKVEFSDEQRASLNIALPDIIFDEQIEVDLGGVTCQITHVGGDHSPDSSIVFIPEERTVFLGDCFYGGFSGNDFYYTTELFFPLLERLETLAADHYVLAHALAPLTRAEFQREARTLRTIGEVAHKTGDDPRLARDWLAAALGQPPSPDNLLDLDAFLLGLKTPAAH